MGERLKVFPKSYSPEISPEWEATAKTVIELFLKATTRRIYIKGNENMPNLPYIVAVNHMGWTEVIVLLNIFPYWIHWMSKQENFENKILRPFCSILGMFPIRRGQIDRQSLQTAIDLLGKGRILGMAPEGTRGRGEEAGKLKRAKHGTIFIANHTSVPILPIGVWGTEELFPLIEMKGLKIEDLTNFKRLDVFVNIGKPFTQHLDIPSETLNKETLDKLTTNLMLEIRDLLPIKYHGSYAGMEKQSI